MGVWTWSDAVRTMLPWHLPLLAAILQTAVAVFIFRLTSWPAAAVDAAAQTAQCASRNQTSRPPHRRQHGRNVRGGLPATGVAAIRPGGAASCRGGCRNGGAGPSRTSLDAASWPMTMARWTGPSSIPATSHRACRSDSASCPQDGRQFGGQFVVSKDLRAGDLREANVLVVLPPGTSKPDEAKGTVPFLPIQKSGQSPTSKPGDKMTSEIRQTDSGTSSRRAVDWLWRASRKPGPAPATTP